MTRPARLPCGVGKTGIISIGFGVPGTSYQFLRHISDKRDVGMTETDRKSKK
jgi:hypothetical protein